MADRAKHNGENKNTSYLAESHMAESPIGIPCKSTMIHFCESHVQPTGTMSRSDAMGADAPNNADLRAADVLMEPAFGKPVLAEPEPLAIVDHRSRLPPCDEPLLEPSQLRRHLLLAPTHRPSSN